MIFFPCAYLFAKDSEKPITLQHSNTQQLLDILLDAKRRGCGSITIDHFSILVNQELGEIPLDAVSQKSTFA